MTELGAILLLRDCSGVRMEVIQRFVQFLQADAIPVVRDLGSIGASGEPLYDAVHEALACSPGREKPFLFDDRDRWLEQDIAALSSDLSEQGTVIRAIRPILTSFDESFELSP
jgi:hypothetical protein